LAGLKATKKPVADFVHCSPVLRLQEKVLDPRLAGKISWRCAVQRNDEGERVLAGVETGDAAIAAQQKFCKNDITIWDFTGRRDSSGNQRESATLFPQDLSLYSRRAVPLFPQGCPFIPAGLSFYSRRAGAAAPGGI
jgi:hypothetical protein